MKRKPFLPGYAWLLLLIVPVWTEILYYGARLLNRGRTHHDFSCGLDRVIPAVPWTIVIYSVCYLLFWVVNYVLCARGEKRDAYRFFCADFLAKAVCFFLFLLLPATMERPVIDGNSLWDDALRLLYQIDAPDNLFPVSLHPLPGQLVQLYWRPGAEGHSPVVSDAFSRHGTGGIRIHADHPAACDRGYFRRGSAGGELLLAGRMEGSAGAVHTVYKRTFEEAPRCCSNSRTDMS